MLWAGNSWVSVTWLQTAQGEIKTLHALQGKMSGTVQHGRLSISATSTVLSFFRIDSPSPSTFNTLPPSCRWEHSWNQTVAARCPTIGDKALQTSVQHVCVQAACMYTGVCVEAVGPQSRRMYEHGKPAGVNKQLITVSLLHVEGKPTERHPVIWHVIILLSRVVICEYNAKVEVCFKTYPRLCWPASIWFNIPLYPSLW